MVVVSVFIHTYLLFVFVFFYGNGRWVGEYAVALIGLNKESSADLVLVQNTVGGLKHSAGGESLTCHYPCAFWSEIK